MALAHHDWRLSQSIIDQARAAGVTITTAESCTGGLVSVALTSIPGSSSVFDRSFITYSNDAKMEMLGVRQDVIGRYGAVSGETARAMADGALRNSNATLAVAITGVAGPGGGTPDKPVGLVWFGLASKNGSVGTERRLFPKGDRDFVRQRATTTALMLLHQAIEPLKG